MRVEHDAQKRAASLGKERNKYRRTLLLITISNQKALMYTMQYVYIYIYYIESMAFHDGIRV